MKKRHHNKNGFALFSVLFIIAAISVMLGMLTQIGGQRVHTARRLTDQIKALAYAEAGIDYAYSILSVDFDQKNNPDAFLLDGGETSTVALNYSSDGFFSLMMGQLESDEGGTSPSSTQSSYGDGSFALTITPISNKYVIINSVGKVGDAIRTAEILVDDENASSIEDYSTWEAFNFSGASGGEFSFGGTGLITAGTNGVGHYISNGPMDIRGDADVEVSLSSPSTISIKNNVTIEGDVTTPDPDWTESKVTITGTAAQEPVKPVKIPDINLTPYYNWAKNNGEVHNGFSTSSSYTPAGGILWVDGDVTISSDAVINGSIIATGNIYISGQANVVPTTTAFAMASRDGNIKNTSTGDIYGLVYAKTGDYAQTANGRLFGQVIVNGDIKKSGVSDIIYRRSVPTPPGAPDQVNAWPVVSAWQK
ncbi:MAG: hypothetical protein KAU94_04265 [Verrucomicrobia bacterium]|nr:hypothetical protein [Verrucomicrobiota bacterium]